MRWLVVALVFLGCSDSPSEPKAPFKLDFSQVVRESGWNAGTERFECRYTLTATATGGEAGEYASWLESEWQFRFTDGTSRTYQLDLVDMLDYWGSERIVTGETLEARRIAWYSARFDLHYTVRYFAPDGRILSDDVWVDCD